MNEKLELALGLSTLLALWVGWIKAGRPRWRRFWGRVGAALDTLVGRDPIHDLASGSELPRIEPLPERLAHIEASQVHQAEIQAQQANTLAKVAEALERIGDHERRIKALEVASLERTAQRLESAAMLGAVARRDDDIVDVPSYETGEHHD